MTILIARQFFWPPSATVDDCTTKGVELIEGNLEAKTKSATETNGEN